ncbi:primosomal protein N' [Polycladidibacter stylochi]|uniref:primosomal protein N' n=1 Tax=Polycladidibacter stylochi TaxID=1807766 RepID=UPI001FCB2470|nr:primosomal protein N' [Pseudovibrio stylochi]
MQTDIFTAHEQENEAPTLVQVLVPVAVERPYTYKVPAGMAVRPGSIVKVPLGPQLVIGAVWDGVADTKLDPKKIRGIVHVYDCAPLGDDLRKFVDWVANWTLSAPGMVLRMVLRSEEALQPEPPQVCLQFNAAAPLPRLTQARQRVLDVVGEGALLGKADLASAAGVSTSVVEGLKQAQVLQELLLPPPPVCKPPDPSLQGHPLTSLQQAAANQLIEAVGSNPQTFLLDGVTGSGKTEVYFEAIAAVLKQQKQALILLPEIALTNQFLERFEKRFAARPAEWHSKITPKTRERTWRAVASGEAKVVIGARSALFLPFKKLGLIVVDEEHDGAYKQGDRVVYNARDMAVLRGHLSKFPVVLASATPSVESRINAQEGRYQLLSLPERATGAAMPRIECIDMRQDGPERGKWLAPKLVKDIHATISQGKQALLFLNRRGYAPLTLCRTCGHRFHCDNCSAWLVEHRFKGKLVCHHCGYSQPIPEKCPECSKPDTLVACGPGVERIAEDISDLFPDARVLVLSSDMPGGAERFKEEMKLVEEGRVDIIIGTQLVAKGHNFPNLTLVGVVDADLGLANGDPRAAEKTYQLMAQVTGRAGRICGQGKGILQTYNPEQPIMNALLKGDAEGFYETESQARKNAGLPPFGRMAALVISAANRAEAEAYSRVLVSHSPPNDQVSILGPAEAALALVRGKYRFRLLVITRRSFNLQGFLRQWLANAPQPRGGVRVQIDVDPQSFL